MRSVPLTPDTPSFSSSVLQHAQPALLYLVPACLGSTFIVALKKGEVGFIFNWSEVDEEEEEEKTKKKDK